MRRFLTAVGLLAVGLVLLLSTSNLEALADPCIGEEPPTNSVPPKLNYANGTLTTTDGLWNTGGCGAAFSYVWKREIFEIADSTEHQYTPTADDNGLALYAEVTATNMYGSNTASSNGFVVPFTPEEPCTPAPPTNTVAPTLTGEAEATGGQAVHVL
jgi:hypothetical protein